MNVPPRSAGGGGLVVVSAITDALVIRQRHPALFARMSAAGCDCRELGVAFDLYLAGVATRWWFVADFAGGAGKFLRGGSQRWAPERSKRRAAGKRQRAARKANR